MRVGRLKQRWIRRALTLVGLVLSVAMLTPLAYAAGDAHFTLASSGDTTVGGTFTVTVSVNTTAGDNANAVDAEVSYPTSLLTFSSASINPIFEAAPTGSGVGCASDSTSTSPISIACASSSAFTGTTQYVTLSFTVKDGGSGSVAIQSSSGVDGGAGGGQDIWDHQATTLSQTFTGSSSGNSGGTGSSQGGSGGLSDTGIAILTIVVIAALTLAAAIVVRRTRQSRATK
jgi:hypothetical protein